MISWLRAHRRSIFVGTITVFLIGTFVGLGGYLFTKNDYTEAVAVVGRTKIPYMRYRVRVNQYLEAVRENQKDREITSEQERQIRQETLRDMIVDEILSQEGERMSLRVSDLELSAAIRNTPRFQSGGRFDQGLYFQVVRGGLRTTPEDYERQFRKSLMSSKVKQLILGSVKIPPAELDREYAAARELYKKAHKGSEKGIATREQFAYNLQQVRALDLVNFLLRQVSTQMDIRSFLDQREQGA